MGLFSTPNEGERFAKAAAEKARHVRPDLMTPEALEQVLGLLADEIVAKGSAGTLDPKDGDAFVACLKKDQNGVTLCAYFMVALEERRDRSAMIAFGGDMRASAIRCLVADLATVVYTQAEQAAYAEELAGHREIAMNLWHMVIGASARMGELTSLLGEGAGSLNIGRILCITGDYQSASTYVTKALECAKQALQNPDCPDRSAVEEGLRGCLDLQREIATRLG
jgi:hypothetical protein